jgi:hypothetical protein
MYLDTLARDKGGRELPDTAYHFRSATENESFHQSPPPIPRPWLSGLGISRVEARLSGPTGFLLHRREALENLCDRFW